MFGTEQASRVFDRSGRCDLEELVGALRRCGFDEGAYLSLNPGLEQVGFDRPAALLHFLTHGYNEARNLSCEPLPSGLLGLAQLELPNRAYMQRLFRTVFFAELHHPRTEDALWRGLGPAFLDVVRAQAGLPYYVVGDSHATQYVRSAWLGDAWLAPLPLVCHRTSASGLAKADSTSQLGRRILRWAAAEVRRVGDLAAPLLLVFGALDAEFLWVSRRISREQRAYAFDDYDAWARLSTSRYGWFLEELAAIVGRPSLRVCAAFPSALKDANYIEGFVAAHRGAPENDAALAQALRAFEIPDLTTRTMLRGHYNGLLRQVCHERGLAFVDAFSPLLDTRRVLGAPYYEPHGGRDHHIGWDAAQAPMVTIVGRALGVTG